MEQEEYDFINTINASLEAEPIEEGNGWIIVRLMDNVYEVVFKVKQPDDLIKVTLEASIAILRLGLGTKEVYSTEPFTCEDGKVAITVVTK